LFKGLVSAGFKMCHPTPEKPVGVFFTVNDQDKYEVVSIAKKFADLGCNLYATAGTAKVISDLGIDVTVVDRLKATKQLCRLMDEGKIDYIVYTGKTDVDAIADYIELHHHAILLGITVLTSLDTANALCDIVKSKFTEYNTELVDINNLRTKRTELSFTKMQASSDDYIYFEDMEGKITCPESLAVNFVDRHCGIGGDGIVIIGKSDIADAKMRIYNQDGTEGKMAGNAIRCVGKYLYDKGIVPKTTMAIETVSGIKEVKVYSFGGKVTSASVDLGEAVLDGETIPSTWKGKQIIDRPMEIDGKEYRVTLVNLGNPHCVIFCDKVDDIDVKTIGPKIENSSYFPEKTNVEFVRVVNESTLKMRVWERGNGETLACGTGAAAAAVASVLNGHCKRDIDITVKVRGGDLIVHYKADGRVELAGNVVKVFEGKVEF
ncbi:MAG: diaminopimelate epimerase, partial [Clostridia bacterium]|nr:diaminopimelate epimerase [Clostridia bacterium]